MKILHVNTLDRGGAANACLRLHGALLRKGVDSNVLILNQTKKKACVYAFDYWYGTNGRFDALRKSIRMMLYDRKIRHRIETLPPYPGVFSFPETIYDITKHPLYQEADIIQLNWVSSFLDEPSFFAKNTKPVIWRMADLYIIGGGPHYEKEFPFEDFHRYIEINKAVRKEALSNPNLDLTIVPISTWTREKADASDLTKKFRKEIIHCGVDLDIYHPYNQLLARQVFDLPSNKKIILYGADSLSDARKGIQLLINSLEKIKQNNIQLVCFGEAPLELKNTTISLGTINDEKLLAILYSAVDLYVTPAIEEAFGQTSIEALACGTPIVTFPTGGGIDILTDYTELGELAPDFTEEALTNAILTAISSDYDRSIIRDTVEKRFDIDSKADEYITLYKSILNK